MKCFLLLISGHGAQCWRRITPVGKISLYCVSHLS